MFPSTPFVVSYTIPFTPVKPYGDRRGVEESLRDLIHQEAHELQPQQDDHRPQAILHLTSEIASCEQRIHLKTSGIDQVLASQNLSHAQQKL
eukprot:554889-Hanusia_phi.AAC.10